MPERTATSSCRPPRFSENGRSRCRRLQHRRQGARTSAAGEPALQRGLVSGPPDPNEVDSYIAINADNTATIYLGLRRAGPRRTHRAAANCGRGIGPRLRPGQDRHGRHVRVDQRLDAGEPDRRDRRQRDSGRGGRGAPRVARARVGAARRSRRRIWRLRRGWYRSRGDAQRSVTYAELVGGKSFDRKFEQFSYNGGIELPRKNAGPRDPKARDAYRIVGTRVPRPDIDEKIRGTYRYVQHVRLPGCFTAASCGRAARARTPSAIPRSSASTSRRSRTSPACRSCGATTSSASWRSASGTPFAPRGS